MVTAICSKLGLLKDIAGMAYLLEVFADALNCRNQQIVFLSLAKGLGIDDDLILGVYRADADISLNHAF